MPECPECGKECEGEHGLNIHHGKAHPETPLHKYQNEDWLREQYIEKERSTPDIAEECGVSHHSIRRQLHKLGIDVRNPKEVAQYRDWTEESHPNWQEGPFNDPDWLRIEYIEKGKTIEQIAGEQNVTYSTIRRRLIRFEIRTRDRVRCGEENHMWKGGKVEFECEMCGRERSRQPRPNREEGPRFCSPDCKGEHFSGPNHPRWTGGVFPYGPGWNENKKERVRERDDHECQICGMGNEDHKNQYGRALHVHHKQKARTIDEPDQRNGMENLITLCHSCHGPAEQMAPLVPQPAAP